MLVAKSNKNPSSPAQVITFPSPAFFDEPHECPHQNAEVKEELSNAKGMKDHAKKHSIIRSCVKTQKNIFSGKQISPNKTEVQEEKN